MKKRTNSVVMLFDGSFIQIQDFVLLKIHCSCALAKCTCNEIPVIFGYPLEVKQKVLCRDRQLRICIDFIVEVCEKKETIAVTASSLHKKCVFLEINRRQYVVPLVNIIETD